MMEYPIDIQIAQIRRDIDSYSKRIQSINQKLSDQSLKSGEIRDLIACRQLIEKKKNKCFRLLALYVWT